VVAADSGMDSDRSLSPSSSATLVLTQECVCVFDVSSDTQLQLFAVADIDCQLTRSATATLLVFSRHAATSVIVRFIFFFILFNSFTGLLHCSLDDRDEVLLPHSWSP